jgi:long-chain fatty acid transport protein
VNSTPAARRPELLSLPLYAAAVLAAGLPLMADATDGPAITGIIASADDAVTAATNPAGLTRLHEAEWVGGIRAFYTSSDFTTTAQSVGGSLTNSSSSSLAIPSLYYARPFNDDVTLGISLTVPAGLGSDPGDNTPGRYVLEKWTLGYVSLTPAAGYRVNEHVSFGAGVNINYAVYDYQTAVFNGVGQPDGRMELRDGDIGLGFQLGMLYELTPMTRFGLSYRSSSSTKFSSTPELSGLTSAREALLPVGIRSKPVTLTSKFPQAVAAGAWHEFANGKSATLDVAWVNFSQFGLSSATLGSTSIDVRDQHYNNIWAASAGMNWPLDDRWTLRFGAAYASSGIDTQNRSFSFRLDRVIGAGAGAEYRWSKDRVVGVNLSYFDLGSAPVNANIPLVGTLSGRFTTNYAIGLDLTLRWIR